jgi:hypothetical protein
MALSRIHACQSDRLWIPQVYLSGDVIDFYSIQFSCPISALYENTTQLY